MLLILTLVLLKNQALVMHVVVSYHSVLFSSGICTTTHHLYTCIEMGRAVFFMASDFLAYLGLFLPIFDLLFGALGYVPKI